MTKIFNIVLVIFLGNLILFACNKNLNDNSNINEETIDIYSAETEKINDDELYYSFEGKLIKNNLYYSDGIINYIDDKGKKVFGETISDNRGEVIIDEKGNVKAIKNNNRENLSEKSLSISEKSIKKIKDSVGKIYEVSWSEWYLVEKDEESNFYILKQVYADVTENINLPEEVAGAKTYFDYNGDICTKLKEYAFYINEDNSYASDGVYEIDGKKYLFNGDGNLVKNNCYICKNGDAYLSDKNGVAIENEGIYSIYLYDDKGNLSITASEVAVLEACSDFGDYIERRYYVGGDGKVVVNSLINYENKIYLSNYNGCLLKNSFYSNLLYFGNDYALVDEYKIKSYEEMKTFVDYYIYKHGASNYYGMIKHEKYGEYKIKNHKNVEENYYYLITRYNDGEKNILNYSENIIKDRFICNKPWQPTTRFEYYDKDGKMVKNKIVQINNEIYLIDKSGLTIPAYKLTKRIIEKFFENDTVNDVKKYQNYFTGWDGKVYVEYQELCNEIRKYLNKSSETNSINNPLLQEEIQLIKERENAIEFELETKDGEAIHDSENIRKLDNFWKGIVYDIDKDGLDEIIVLKKDSIVNTVGNICDDEGNFITPRQYLLGIDIYKIKNNKYEKVLNKKVQGIFYRDAETLRVGWKADVNKKFDLYIEYRGLSWERGNGSFVDVKKYRFNGNDAICCCAFGDAGSMIGEWAENLEDEVNQIGIDFDSNDFYDYKDSYLEKDKSINLIFGIDYGIGSPEDNYKVIINNYGAEFIYPTN